MAAASVAHTVGTVVFSKQADGHPAIAFYNEKASAQPDLAVNNGEQLVITSDDDGGAGEWLGVRLAAAHWEGRSGWVKKRNTEEGAPCAAHCGKASWNGQAGGFCTVSCKAKGPAPPTSEAPRPQCRNPGCIIRSAPGSPFCSLECVEAAARAPAKLTAPKTGFTDLIQRVDPVKSGAALVAFDFIFFLVVYMQIRPAPFLCNVGMLAIAIGGAVKFCVPTISESTKAPLSKEQISAIVENCVQGVEFVLIKGKEVALWTEWQTAATALVGLEVVRRGVPWVNISLLVFIGGNGLFIVPLVMERKRDVIKQQIQPLIAKVLATKDSIKAKVPHFDENAGYMTGEK